MHRQPLLNELYKYQPPESDEELIRQQFVAFVSANERCFDRHLTHGHITGSAWIINPEGTKCLLIYHRKLNKWLQPGGHTDGDSLVARSAQREGMEETGLDPLPFFHDSIFDLDIHSIPQRKNVPRHLHYDVRYLFQANTERPFRLSAESTDIGWFSLAEAGSRCGERSILRMIDKTRYLFGSNKQ